MSNDRDVLDQATLLLDAFIMEHRQAAMPAMVAACVGWSVQHGASDLIRDTLNNAVQLIHNAERAWEKMQS